jgi:hypothetical protein
MSQPIEAEWQPPAYAHSAMLLWQSGLKECCRVLAQPRRYRGRPVIADDLMQRIRTMTERIYQAMLVLRREIEPGTMCVFALGWVGAEVTQGILLRLSCLPSREVKSGSTLSVNMDYLTEVNQLLNSSYYPGLWMWYADGEPILCVYAASHNKPDDIHRLSAPRVFDGICQAYRVWAKRNDMFNLEYRQYIVNSKGVDWPGCRVDRPSGCRAVFAENME